MNRMRTRLVAAAAAMTVLSGCGASGGAGGQAEGFPMTVQNCGRDVTIDKPPQRVMTIGPESADIVRAAGGIDKIIAHQAEFPIGQEEQFRNVRQFGNSADDPPGSEAIIAERPDLVVSYGLVNSDPGTLESAGISSLVLTGMCGTHDKGRNVDGVVDFETIYRDLELYGRLFGTGEQAAGLVADLRQRVGAVEQAARQRAPLKAAVLWPGGGGTPYAYGSVSMTDTMIRALGMTNVFADVKGFGREISKEELIDRNPDIVVLYLFGEDSADEISALKAIPGMNEVTAIKKGQIVALQSTFLRPSASVVTGLEMMAADVASYQ